MGLKNHEGLLHTQHGINESQIHTQHGIKKSQESQSRINAYVHDMGLRNHRNHNQGSMHTYTTWD